MFKRIQIVSLIAASLAITPTAVLAQQVPPSEQPLNQQQPSGGSNSLLPSLAGAAVNAVSGGDDGLAKAAEIGVKAASGERVNITDVAGTAIKLLSPRRRQQPNNIPQNPGDIPPQAQPGEPVGAENPNPPQVQAPQQTQQPPQQATSQKFPYGCQASGQVQVSLESLNPVNAVTNSITGAISQLTGRKPPSPNQMNANGNIGC